MNADYLTPIVNAAVGVVVAWIALSIRASIPVLAAILEKRTGIALTAQQIGQVQATVDTAAGLAETAMHKGQLALADVGPCSPPIVALAQDAIARVPDAAAAQGVTVDAIALKIVAKIETCPVRLSSP